MEFKVRDIAEVRFDREKNIVYINFLKEYLADKEIKEVIDTIHNTINPKFAVISDFSKVIFLTQEARKTLSQYRYEDIIAASGVFKNNLQAKIANLFLTFNKPKYPIKFFFSKNEAEKWILNILSAHKINN